MILETNDMFAVTWKADKYDKMRIFRKGLWDEKCRQWISKQGDRLLTYFDIDKNDYRTAKNYSIIYATESKVQ